MLPALDAVLHEFPVVEIMISTEYSLSQLHALFSLDVAIRIVVVTPDRTATEGAIEHYRCEREIENWLREHGREYEPWVVRDDSDWMFSPSCTRLILVDGATGFTDRTAATLRSHF